MRFDRACTKRAPPTDRAYEVVWMCTAAQVTKASNVPHGDVSFTVGPKDLRGLRPVKIEGHGEPMKLVRLAIERALGQFGWWR